MRIRNVIQLHWVNRMTAFGWPLIILGIAFGFILILGALVSTQGERAADELYEGLQFNGAIFALLGPLVGWGFAAIYSYFPLATGLGLTRKEFSAGTSLVFLGNGLLYSVIISLGKMIEVATEGFGVHVRFFDVVWVGTGPVWQTLIQAFLIIVAVQFVGAAIMTGHARWGVTFVWTFLISLALVGLVIAASATLSADARNALWELLTMGWGPWMGVTLGLGVFSAGAFLGLVRRAQAR